MRLEPLLRMRADLGTRYPIGLIPKGRRTVWQLKGGEVEGPNIRGTVAPVGGEFELIDSDGSYHVDVRLVIQTEDRANIFVQYFGALVPNAQALEQFKTGEAGDFGGYYFVTQPRFETSHEKYRWLNTAMAIAEGRHTGKGVEYLMYHCISDNAVGLAKAPELFGYKGGK